MIDKKAETQVRINPLITSRWSGRAYDPQREIKREQLLAMLEAARWAPSCFGDEPWRYIVCHSPDDRQAWQNLLDCLSEGNQQWARQAPMLILVMADTLFSHDEKKNPWADYDTGAASISLCLQATALGLMTHQMGGFDTDRARQAFAVPQRYRPMSVIAVGYQLAKERISDDMLERELSERRRRPLDERFYAGRWGEKIS